MKPTKNRFFCKDCGKSKMLFETEKKANTFIKFNSEEIEEETGYKPERSYFCTFCSGWHVTSQKEYLVIKSRTEKILDLYEQEKEKKVLAQAEKVLIRAEKQAKLKEILDILEKYISILECSKENNKDFIETLNKAFVELGKAKNLCVTFHGSSKRRKNAEGKLNILKGNVKNTTK